MPLFSPLPSVPPPASQAARPSLLDDASVLAKGTYAGELDFLAGVRKGAFGDAPFGATLDYGLTSRLQAGISVGALSAEPSFRPDERDAFGDLGATIKALLVSTDSFQTSITYQSTLLLADRARDRGLADHSLYLSASEAIGRLSLLGETGVTAPGGTVGRTVPIFAGSVGYDLGRQSVFLQANQNTPRLATVRNRLDLAAGVTRDVGAGFQIQALVGQGGRGRQGSGLFLGASYRFGSGR